MASILDRFWADESGQGLTEYALIGAIVSLGLVAVLFAFRDEIGRFLEAVGQAVTAAPSNTYTPTSGG